MKQKICIIVQNYYEIDPRVRRKVSTLVENGNVVDVIALKYKKRPFINQEDGATIYNIPLGKMRGGIIRYVFEYFIFWFLSSMILNWQFIKKRYDTVDINNLPDFLVFAAWFPKLMGSKIILDMHEITPEFFMSKYKVGPSSFVYRILVRLESLSCKYADHVIASNDLIAEKVKERNSLNSKLTIVVNTADDKFFRSGESVNEKNRKRNSPIIFMYHGTLTTFYGLDIALEALSIVRSKLPGQGVQLHIIGEGSTLNDLRIMRHKYGLDDLVFFKEPVPIHDISKTLEGCDVGLIPTRRDVFLDLSFSNKLVEYVALRKPVVAARLRGYRHYFREESLGFFEPNNPISLAEAMIKVIKNRSAWEELAENAFQDYQAITWKTMSKRYIDLVNYSRKS